MHSHKLKSEDLLNFILGGKSLFTIKNSATGGRFTYKVSIPKDQNPENATVFFVKLLTGSSNDDSYSYKYIGFIGLDGGGKWFFRYGNKSKITENAKGVIAFEFVFNRIVVPGWSHKNLEVWHEGKCCRCGRTLTVPESLMDGVGAECKRIIAAHAA